MDCTQRFRPALAHPTCTVTGVISTRVGYRGGEVPKATYRNHGNHAEAIEINFASALLDEICDTGMY